MDIQYPLLLDGGLSNQLESHGCDINHSLWTAKLLQSDPESIVKAHLAYLEAGAQCIITSSYQATIPGFQVIGIDPEIAEKLILKSVDLALEAVKRCIASHPGRTKPLIAASIGPYGAYLSDGSEYKGNYGITDDQLRNFHKPRIDLLDSSRADFLACETIPSFQEARVLSDILKKTRKKAWISFSCKDGQHINDGTPIANCTDFLSTNPNVFAVGVNCTKPQYIPELIGNIKLKSGKMNIVVYPNSGEVFDADTKTWSGMADPLISAKMVQEWLALGADIMGGCCRIGPPQIQAMAQAIAQY